MPLLVTLFPIMTCRDSPRGVANSHLSPVLARSEPHAPTTCPPSDETTTIYESMLPVSTLTDMSDFDQECTFFVHDIEEDSNVMEGHTEDHSVA